MDNFKCYVKFAHKCEVLSILCFGIALRSIVSLHSYSGYKKSPQYGDYEAQRHWQEITVNLKPYEWYKNGSYNNLLYWGLDYPPLTAYHSYLLGHIAKHISPEYVELKSSEGYESDAHKNFMRLTVLFIDLIIYLPSVLIIVKSMEKIFRCGVFSPTIILMVVYPGQILIDNGHFQYNNFSLGLTTLAVAAILERKDGLGAFFHCLALNYKQMELYHSLPIFIYLLGRCIQQKSFRHFIKLSCVVVITFLIIWMPWIRHTQEIFSVLQRMFPIGRGIFEDKVSNFWCLLNIFCKLKNFNNSNMAIICLISTLSVLLPINVKLINSRSCEHKFILSLFNCSLTFFLFSYQVHEKSILLAAIPASYLFYWKPVESLWFLETSIFSMFPLFQKDSLVIAFLALLTIFHISIYNIYFSHCEENLNSNRFSCLFLNLSLVLNIFLTLASIFFPSPQKYPYFWPFMVTSISCIHFLFFLSFGIYYMFI